MFLAIVITMVVISYPTLQQYWCRSWPFQTSTFSSIMPRDRFLLFLKFLHLTNNNQIPLGHPGHNRLFKLKSFMTALITHFKLLYRPHREISVDESMISYKGRLSFLQYMPKNPEKVGDESLGACWFQKCLYLELGSLLRKGTEHFSRLLGDTSTASSGRRTPQHGSSCLFWQLLHFSRYVKVLLAPYYYICMKKQANKS